MTGVNLSEWALRHRTLVVYTMLLSCFLDIGEPRQRRPTDVVIVFLCFLGVSYLRRYRAKSSMVVSSV